MLLHLEKGLRSSSSNECMSYLMDGKGVGPYRALPPPCLNAAGAKASLATTVGTGFLSFSTARHLWKFHPIGSRQQLMVAASFLAAKKVCLHYWCHLLFCALFLPLSYFKSMDALSSISRTAVVLQCPVVLSLALLVY